MKANPVRVRFAPSPTGFLHVGGLRTALFNFLWARKNKGAFILRIEDTDRTREVPGATENIIETLQIFKLNPDEGPIKQSDRLDIYKKHIKILLDKGAAYKCFCTAERISDLKKQADAAKMPFRYDKHCLKNPGTGENFVIRQNVPEEGSTEFDDAVYGHIRVENRILDDGILLKSDGWPVYNFANVVDDHLMEVSHAIRGEEFISSTPKHILLYQAFSWEPPEFVHLPLLLSRERKKLSKRDGDVAVKEYLDKGYLPEALLNFIALLGWNPKTTKEIFSLEELTSEFDLKKINRAGAIFDLEKLNFINKEWMAKIGPGTTLENRIIAGLQITDPEIEKWLRDFIMPLLLERLPGPDRLDDILAEFKFFFVNPEYAPDLLVWKDSTAKQIGESLNEAKKIISNLKSGKVAKPEIEKQFIEAIGERSKGAMLWPLRVALSGLKASPGPFDIIAAFGGLPNGKKIILERIDSAIAKSEKL